MNDINNTWGSRYRTPTQDDMDIVSDYIIDMLRNVDESGDVSIIQESITNNRIAYKNDESRTATAEANLSDTQILNKEMEKGEQSNPQEYLSQAYKECQQANENLKGTYYTKPEDMQPVDEEDIDTIFDTDTQNQAKINAANSEFTNRYNDDIFYKHCTYKIGNTVKQFKLAKVNVRWDSQFKEGSENIPRNIEILKALVTNSILELYGSWNRIYEIAVVDSMLIMNGVCYFPSINENDLSKFPLDSVDYIKNGCVAPFFNWKYLRNMKRLSVLSIDDENFYANEIANDLGLCRSIGIESAFNICQNLMTFILGRRTLSRDELHSEKSVPMKKSLAKVKRNMVFSDGYKINVYNATNGLQDYMFGSLKTYATNRGNKGLFRFCVGTAVRAGLAGVSGILNAGTHLLGGAFQVLKEMCTDSVVIQKQN